MSDETRAEKFLEIFNKGKEFTEELIRENQRLRYRVAALETEAPSMSQDEVQRLRDQIAHLTEELADPIGFALSYQATREFEYTGEKPKGNA